MMKKPQYYRGKKIAEVDIYTNPRNIKSDDFVMSIKITILKIEDDGDFDKSSKNVWGIRINFYPEELRKIKFSLKLVEALMSLATDKTYINDTLNGTQYTNFLKKLKKDNIKWEL